MGIVRFAGLLAMTLLAATAARAEFGSVEIAPVAEALTFARVERGDGARLMLVSSYAGGVVSGIDVTETLGSDDPIDAYRSHGYDALAALNGATVNLPVEDLSLPVRLTASHIAAGTNFPEHAEEATVTDGPFLFPKEVVPTPFNADIPAGEALLDYEVELCFVALDAIDLDAPPARAGLMLCNDVTDRAALMRHIDPNDVTSGKGFTTGKSAPGFMPVGNLFVIPRDLRAFAAAVELRLYRNGELKQSARQSDAIWDFDELLRQTKARENTTWAYDGRMVGLPIADGRIPARTAILAGTPDGTIFKGIDKSAMALGAWDWIAGGWDRPVTAHVVERQIAKERAAKRYLQPGERVRIAVGFLGEIDSTVAP
ncbi:fumarylacetoacetate hydrolase family protein [Parvibaculum sp.]|uniref:fumarylacetoacetate hydrolase family protein n=1 Tax=Parvibaculum sp. TaxID=2024848 RepID=UPI001DB220E6|nr:fumarylacetoacetate hydrolase family protein [Parvibaculum sp.]MBX3489999.1 fumarylacetoacetate hydrolase family protein [Parvibaculum sp.]MCW5726013.1 fumarylacetoacetate hydrolase family protein [Parvibaculum sp.]